MTSHNTDMPEGLRRRQPSRHGGFGWVRDLPDSRDFMYAAPLPHLGKLPPKVDLRPQCPAIYDQGQLGSCTANGIAAAIEFDQRKEKKTEFVPSRLFIYYNERAIEGHINEDSGAQIRDGVKSVAKVGAPPESMCPYDISKFTKKPSPAAYAEAKKDIVKVYARVPQVQSQMLGCLADGFPFVFGFTVYESFESDAVAKTGMVPMPAMGEQVLGGHCVVAVGYDSGTRHFIVRNSWGVGWGLQGYCMMPFEYLLNSQYSSDFWTIRTV
ncbi:C1 family peptidase [Ramlibacter agri]|nr:C1 family peptidase [Ramlibacter agri]